MALGVRNLGVAIGCAGLLFTTSCAGIMGPSTQAPSPGGPEIQQATLEPYDGPKARVAVSQFVIRAGKGYETVGEGMSDMLGAALLQSNRYIVLERRALSNVLAEQDLGASGPIRPETAARIGHIEGAELLIMGTITEFEPGAAASSRGSIMGGILGMFVCRARSGRARRCYLCSQLLIWSLLIDGFFPHTSTMIISSSVASANRSL